MTHPAQQRASRRPGRLDPYVRAVLATLRRRRLAAPADPLLVALSGGRDSMALLAALAALRDEGEVGELFALHVDHGLRPGVAAEAAVAFTACARLGVPFRSVQVTVGTGNVQAAARRARYAALREEAARRGATRIATGHTRTDQAETVLLRLLRGAGARGLAGIPPRRGPIVRPLLDRSRAEGAAFLERLGLPWCDDPTNDTPRYARNRVRQRLWPQLQELNPAVEAALARTADLLRDDERALEREARALVAGAAEVAIGPLRAAPRAVRRRVVRRLARRGARGATVEAGHVEAVLRLLARPGGGRAALPGAEARIEAGRLSIGAARPPPAEVAPVAVGGPGRYAVPELGLAVEVASAVAAPVDWPLLLRTRRPGDRFRPAGGRGSKKLKAWLIDRKVARARRDSLVLLVDRAGAVLAIPELGAVAAGWTGRLDVRVETAR